jgi:hypothetical protein
MVPTQKAETQRIREKAGLSKTEAAALARCAPLTWRLYEVDPNSVSLAKRSSCDAAVSVMRRMLGEHAA